MKEELYKGKVSKARLEGTAYVKDLNGKEHSAFLEVNEAQCGLNIEYNERML